MSKQEIYSAADTLACNHINYLKNMNPMGFSFKQAERARIKFRDSYIKRIEAGKIKLDT